MLGRTTLMLAAMSVALGGVAYAKKKKDDIKPSVTYAKSWETAVEEAKTLNVPLVVHSHGFYWGPCWGMHGAVLQNDKYIEFANDNTVEVMALQRLKEGVDKGDPKAEQFDTEDEDGNPIKYMVEFPNLTLEEMYALNTSKAGTYNDTGKIPYTAIVDPHTEERMLGLPGGQSAKKMIEVVTEQKAKLEEKYGPSLSRSDIKDVQDLKKECNEILADKGAGKALGQFAKDYKKLSKKGEKITAMLDAYQATLMEKAAEELDQADELIEAGDFSGAKKIFASLKSALKKTDLAERIDAGYARIKELQSADE